MKYLEAELEFYAYRDSLMSKMPNSPHTADHLKSNKFAILYGSMQKARMHRACPKLRGAIPAYIIKEKCLFILDKLCGVDPRNHKAWHYIPWKYFVIKERS